MRLSISLAYGRFAAFAGSSGVRAESLGLLRIVLFLPGGSPPMTCGVCQDWPLNPSISIGASSGAEETESSPCQAVLAATSVATLLVLPSLPPLKAVRTQGAPKVVRAGRPCGSDTSTHAAG